MLLSLKGFPTAKVSNRGERTVTFSDLACKDGWRRNLSGTTILSERFER
jgi:hypothetical protein